MTHTEPKPGRGLRDDRTREVTGHARTGRLRSIRLRLLVPIVLAAAGLFTLGAVQTDAAVRSAQSARRAEAVASTAIVTVRLEHQLEQEAAEADGLRARGGTAGATLLTAAQDQTNLAAANFRTVIAAARRFAPSLGLVMDAAEAQLSTLSVIRANAQHLPSDAISGELYDKLDESLLAVADALPGQLTDVDLAASGRAIAAMADVEHLGAEQRDLLHQVLRRGGFVAGEQARLANLVGAQDERLAEFRRNADAHERDIYDQQASGSDAATALAMRAGVLVAVPDAAALHADPDAWYIAQSNLLRRLHQVQLDLSHNLGRTANVRQVGAANRALLTSLGTALVIGIAFGAALLFAVRTSRRLRRLRRAALGVANTELPGAIASLTRASDPVAVRNTLSDSAVRAQALAVSGRDEIGEVGAALSTVHRQALRLAADQALLRLDIEALFIALSRRGQTLIQRQLQLIDEYERAETDQAALHRLYALDHLAARMRRNEENLLVLAGGEPGRRIWNPVPLEDIVQAAVAEIEDGYRVDPAAVAEVAIAAHAARDVVHLLAELLENATGYSPPSTRVRISARRTVDSVTVTVFDEGIGMPAGQVSELNERLRRPTMLTAELAGTMGLLVVARLAARHGIEVELRSAPGQGTAALVALPIPLLAPMPAGPAGTDLGIRQVTRQLPASAPTSPAPAPPAVPPAAVPAVPAPATVPLPQRRPDTLATASAPGAPAPARTAPASAATGPAPAGVAVTAPALPTPAGLPRRRPGGLLLSGSAVSAQETAGADDGTRPPDPDTVRARLSGLASGLAQAARHTQSRP